MELLVFEIRGCPARWCAKLSRQVGCLAKWSLALVKTVAIGGLLHKWLSDVSVIMLLQPWQKEHQNFENLVFLLPSLQQKNKILVFLPSRIMTLNRGNIILNKEVSPFSDTGDKDLSHENVFVGGTEYSVLPRNEFQCPIGIIEKVKVADGSPTDEF